MPTTRPRQEAELLSGKRSVQRLVATVGSSNVDGGTKGFRPGRQICIWKQGKLGPQNAGIGARGNGPKRISAGTGIRGKFLSRIWERERL